MSRLIRAAIVLLLASVAAQAVAESAYITLNNRSDYEMAYSVWEDGTDCSDRRELPASTDLNLSKPAPIDMIPGKLAAVGVGIFQMKGKAPVLCEYILSFTPAAGQEYVLEYLVHDRRCYGTLYRVNGQKFQIVEPEDAEGVTERLPEWGWDQFEPGCS